MTEPMRWLDACRVYKERTGVWCVPKKGTKEHDEIAKIIHEHQRAQVRAGTAEIIRCTEPGLSARDIRMKELEANMDEKHKEYIEKLRIHAEERRKVLEETEKWRNAELEKQCEETAKRNAYLAEQARLIEEKRREEEIRIGQLRATQALLSLPRTEVRQVRRRGKVKKNTGPIRVGVLGAQTISFA
jgi:hypothetical protein